MCGHWRRMYGKKLGKELRLYVLKQASRTGKRDCGPRREGRRDWPRALLQRRIRTTSTRKVQAWQLSRWAGCRVRPRRPARVWFHDWQSEYGTKSRWWLGYCKSYHYDSDEGPGLGNTSSHCDLLVTSSSQAASLRLVAWHWQCCVPPCRQQNSSPIRLGTAGRDSDCRVQPRQTDVVDQLVAREANGYKAEGFSRQRGLYRWIAMPWWHHLGAEHLSSCDPNFETARTKEGICILPLSICANQQLLPGSALPGEVSGSEWT